MAKTKVVELTEPIHGHRGLVRSIELWPPTFADLTDIGMPATWVELATGGGFLQESPTAIAQWAQRLSGLAPDILGRLCIADALALRVAVITFFTIPVAAAVDVEGPPPIPASPEDEAAKWH